jgi:predicted HicB family RNase H-like nuclease
MKRMQVLFEETEYRRIVRLAKRQGMTLAEWVRQTLRFAYRQEPLGD